MARSETLKSGPVHFWFVSGHFVLINTELDQISQLYVEQITQPNESHINGLFWSRFSKPITSSNSMISLKKKLAHKLSVYLRFKTAMIRFPTGCVQC